MRKPENVVHRGMLESSRIINTQARHGVGRHRVYWSGDLPHLPEGMWVVGPHGLSNRISPEKIESVACGISPSLWRLAAKDSTGKILDLGQPLSADTLDVSGTPLGELGAEKAHQKGVPPYTPAFDYARRGLTASQAVFVINALRVASSLGKSLKVYLPGSEYRIWTKEYGKRLGVDADAVLDAHFDVLRSQITKLGKKLFPHTKIEVIDTTPLLTEQPAPFEGHWTKTASGIGMGKKLLEIAMRDDAASTQIFKAMRKKHGLFLLQTHATGLVNDAKPYDEEKDGLHLVVSAAPVVYLKKEVSRLEQKHGKEKVEKILGEQIERGEDIGTPAAEFYLGAKAGRVWDPNEHAFQGYKRALQGIRRLENFKSLQELLRKLNRIVAD